MATTNENVYEEDDELAKLAQTNENMQKTKTMSANEIAGINNKIGAYEKQYGGNLFDIDANSFTDATARQQFLTDRSDYGTLTSYRDTYNAQIESAKKAQAEKEAYANTRRTLMEKYIPETLNAMGLTGSGLAADTLLRMNNNYDNYILGAKSESQQAQGDAMQSYRDAWQTYTRQKDAEALNQLENDSQNYQLFITDINNGMYDGNYDLALENAKLSGLDDPMYLNQIETKLKERETELKGRNWLSGYGVSTDTTGFDANANSTPEILKGLDVIQGKDQTNYINRIMEVSQSWGEDMNGTAVGFNFGWGYPKMYVFYNGKWYKSKYDYNKLKSLNLGKVYERDYEFYKAFGKK